MNTDGDERARAVLALLEAGRSAEAVTEGKNALESDPDNARLHMLLGIALEQVGRVDEALPALRQATELDPSDPETFHNLAVALYNRGDATEARIMANEALKLDPVHEGALQTISWCDSPREGASFEAEGKPIEPAPSTFRHGLDDPQAHVLNLGGAWTKVGFGVVAYCIGSFAYMIFNPPLNAVGLRHEGVAVLSFFLYVTSGLAAVIWTLIDVIDRREKFVWLLPMWVCGFAALPVLPLALYIAMSRKVPQVG